MAIYTDLAQEARELDPDLSGVFEDKEYDGEICITRIRIENEDSASRLGKRMGSYITIDAPGLSERIPGVFSAAAERLRRELCGMIEGFKVSTCLIAGLGNRAVTPDSLGPKTAERVFVTRHINENLPGVFGFELPSVAAAVPGVLGTTGIETVEILEGIVKRIEPDLVIAIDSLASRRASRISSTIQLSDAGIEPGAGVGNIRRGLNRQILGVPVISIGVPLVVCAATITHDVLAAACERSGMHISETELDELIHRISDERTESLIVTPKDIDCIVEDMSGVLSEGINKALFGERYEEIKELLM